MSETTTRRRPGRAARRFGYVLAVVINLGVWFAVNVLPGWEVVPFLTDDFLQVLGLVNLSLLAAAAANVTYVVADPPWYKAAWDVGLSLVGLLASLRFIEVFPVDFADQAYDLTTLVRAIAIVGAVGSGIGVVSALVRFGREVYRTVGGQAGTP